MACGTPQMLVTMGSHAMGLLLTTSELLFLRLSEQLLAVYIIGEILRKWRRNDKKKNIMFFIHLGTVRKTI